MDDGGSDPVGSLIDDLKTLREGRSKALTQIRNIDALIRSLQDLSKMIGADRVKRSVVDQTRFLMVRKMSPKDREGHMLHTVIYGPPGTGKTTLGKILASIWMSIGLSNIPPPTAEPLSKLRCINKVIDTAMNKLNSLRVRSRTPVDAKRDIGEVYYMLDVAHQNVSDEISKRSKQNMRILESKFGPNISIVSRPDFVAEYVGQSGPKTRRLLERNRGSVVFIDEAYSLHYGGRDRFGSEALTELIRFMSEHPDDCVIIFSGYKDAMESGIFTAQKGLKRRCTWVFDIPGYNKQQLSCIFKLQIEEKGWKIHKNLDLEDFFDGKMDKFPHYGGDTLRLLFQGGLVISNRLFVDLILPDSDPHLEMMFDPLPVVFTELGGIKQIYYDPIVKPEWIVTREILDEAYARYIDNSVDERSGSKENLSYYL